MYSPKLAEPVPIDTAVLPESEAAELERLVAAANFFALPQEIRSLPETARDFQEHTVTIEDGRRRHTVTFVGPIEDPDQQELLDALKAHAKAHRAAARARCARQDTTQRE
jgi:hypothetical protein